jgi:ATPase subunit of ABC transporter with duplicated ATPase domains
VSGASYSAYKKAKLLAIEQQKRAYDMQQKRHQKLTAAADKLYKATKRGELFQSSDHDLLQRDYKRERAGRSGKKAAAVEKLRDAEEKVERVVEQKPLQIKFDPVSAGIDSAIILDDVVIGHDGQSIHLPPTTLRIDYGERIAIVGYNGIGKSTLLKTMTGEVDAVSGEVNIGRDLRMGNLMQEHETLSRAKITRDVIATQTGSDCFKGGSHVIGYGLSRRQIDQPIEELNPGARARLILAMFSMRRVNTLILDEPTNHLDEEAVVEVTGSLNTFEGTIVVVSHDREFLRTLNITRTFALTEYGLVEIDNIDDFVDEVCESVEAVVQGMFPGYNM